MTEARIRDWLARQLRDDTLTDAEAFSIVAFHPSIQAARAQGPQPLAEGEREELERLRAALVRNRAALDLIDPARPLQYATTMDLMRKDMDAALNHQEAGS